MTLRKLIERIVYVILDIIYIQWRVRYSSVYVRETLYIFPF